MICDCGHRLVWIGGHDFYCPKCAISYGWGCGGGVPTGKPSKKEGEGDAGLDKAEDADPLVRERKG